MREHVVVGRGEALESVGPASESADRGFVFIPRGKGRTVWNSGDAPVRGPILISPGDAEHEFAVVDLE